MYSQGNEIMHVYTAIKQYNRLLARWYVQHSYLHRFYLKTAPHHADNSKEMATPKDKGGRQGPWTECGVEPG